MPILDIGIYTAVLLSIHIIFLKCFKIVFSFYYCISKNNFTNFIFKIIFYNGAIRINEFLINKQMTEYLKCKPSSRS